MFIFFFSSVPSMSYCSSLLRSNVVNRSQNTDSFHFAWLFIFYFFSSFSHLSSCVRLFRAKLFICFSKDSLNVSVHNEMIKTNFWPKKERKSVSGDVNFILAFLVLLVTYINAVVVFIFHIYFIFMSWKWINAT